MMSLEQVLVSGGDARLSVDSGTGLNRYGCAPLPRPNALSFGSSTASSISPEAFQRIQHEYDSFHNMPSSEIGLDARMEALRGEMKALLGLAENGTEIVFSPSGTDSTLQALALIRALTGNCPTDCILPASDETGTGIPLALSGRHFSSRTSEGVPVIPGEAIAGLGDEIRLISLPTRSVHGATRPQSCQDQDVWEAIETSVDAGHQVLLQVMDCSKLGASSPSLECRRRLLNRFAGSIHFVVDACQMRLSRARLQDYLAQGHLVIISGSKFFTGPPFSGALLVPASMAARLKTQTFAAAGLRDYTSRSAWPVSWTAFRESLPDRANFGQYFRWMAALEEMRAYFAVPQEFRRRALGQFALMAETVIESYAPECLLLENGRTPADCDDESEMNTKTIFPFFVRQGNRLISYADTVTLFNSLNQDMTPLLPAALAAQICHIGQPVRVPLGDGEDTGALRICADARLVAQLWSQHQLNPEATLLAQQQHEICTILAKTALIAQHL